jgi:hypothetical protein
LLVSVASSTISDSFTPKDFKVKCSRGTSPNLRFLISLLNSETTLPSGVVVQRLFGALLFTNLGAPKVRRTEQKCAERSLD